MERYWSSPPGGPSTTDQLPEGTQNLYYTNERVDDEVNNLLVQGTGIMLSYNDIANTLTISCTVPVYTDEMVDDRVALLIQNGTGISWSYNDPAGTLTPTITLAPFSTTNLSEGSNLYFTDERAQDAVGGILTDSSSIDFTYNDAGNTITAVVLPAGVDHNSLGNLATGDVHTQYTKDPGTVVDKEITIWSGTGGRDFQTSSGIMISSLLISPTASNTNLLLDGNGTGVVAVNNQLLPKNKPVTPPIGAYSLHIDQSTGACFWFDSGPIPVVTTMQVTYGNSTGSDPGTAKIVLTATKKGITFADANTPISGNLFAIKDFSLASEYFAVTSNGFSGPQMVVDDIVIDGNTLSSASDINLDATVNNINLLSTTKLGSNFLFFGSADESQMFYDTGIVINPGAGAALTIGSATGSSDADLLVNKVGLFGSPISSNAVVNLATTGAARQALFFSLTYTGAASSAGPIVSSVIDQGSSTSMIMTSVTAQVTLDTTNHTTHTQTGVVAQMGISAGTAISTGTYTTYGFRAQVSTNGIGGSHSGGTFRRYGFFQDAITALGGSPGSDLVMGAFFNNSINLLSNTSILFDSTSTALGDTGIQYASATTDLRITVDGTLAFIHDADKNISKLDFKLDTVGSGFYVKEGTNATMGISTMAGGTVVVNTTKVTANSRILLTNNVNGGTLGSLSVSARTAGTSFTISSTNILDTSQVAWVILEPA